VVGGPTSCEHLCRACGCQVARDHEGDHLCGPCQRERRKYDPRWDPDFADVLLALLIGNKRRPVHVYRELDIEHCGVVGWECVKVHIRRFRRHGYRISGCHDGTYTYLGWRQPR